MFSIDKLADPKFFQENREPAHSDHPYYRTALEAAEGKSSFVRTLDGLWYFHYAKNPNLRPKGFEKLETDVRSWQTIRVPAHWQLEGYGTPQYTNQAYSWDGHEAVKPGAVPVRENPVGSYVKYFGKPADWDEVHLTLQGVESAVVVYCNGRYVGYSEDSFTPANFDLTPYLVEGENKLALQVYRFSSGSWLEDQDYWRFAGIFREVQLYTKPAVHIENMLVTAKPVHDYRDGKLKLALDWNGKKERRVDWQLLDPKGDVIQKQSETSHGKHSVIKIGVDNAALWSAEAPNLYTLILSVCDEDGKLMEIVPQRVGFREFALRDGLMQLNGKRIVFKGVNRHEFDAYNGRALDPALFEQDIRVMKRHNINALRCSHYPNSSRIYDLCDQYGLYVIDETNLETHGTWQKNGIDVCDENTLPKDHKEWKDAVLDRAQSMFERDKNHAAILIWSCGNESFGGSVIHEESKYFHRVDPTRLVHYEGLFHDRSYPDTSDMESQMYTPEADVEAFLASHPGKPFILCEYTHSMGNSTGGMHKYTELSEREPRYQGGFIWDFVDQAIMRRDERGNEVPGYGGDFGDRSTDYDFSGDGILFADRSLSAKMQEVKYDYQDYRLHVSRNQVTIENHSLFTDTAAYELRIELLLDGKKIWQDVYDAPSILPGGTGSFQLDDLPETGAGEVCVTASLCLKKESLWAERGFEIAFGQGVWQSDGAEAPNPEELPVRMAFGQPECGVATPQHRPIECAEALRVVCGDINLGVQGEGFEILFSSAAGNLISYKYDGEELLEEQPRPSFWRAPVSNDYGNRRDFALAQWKLASLYQKCVKKELLTEKGWQAFDFFGQLGIREYEAESLSVRFTWALATNPASEVRVTYTVGKGGVVTAAMDYQKVEGLPEIPDFALVFTLSEKYDQLTYYGLGPSENYWDRQSGAKLGIWQRAVREEVQPYLRPQETGNHGGVRWIRVTDARGRGLLLTASEPMEASALPYSCHELENARHAYDLPDSQHTFLRASLGQDGVGGDDTWGAPVLEEYTNENVTKHFEFQFRAI